jgi:hypothetical protein
MPRVAAIFIEVSHANNFRNQLSYSPWSSKVSLTIIEGDIFYIVNNSSSSIKLSSKEAMVIEMEVSQNDLEPLKLLIKNTSGQYVPQDEFIKWGI